MIPLRNDNSALILIIFCLLPPTGCFQLFKDSSFKLFVMSLSYFLPVSFLSFLCPWKFCSSLSISYLVHALLSDDICIFCDSSHLVWNPTPCLNGTLWLPLKPFPAPCPNTLNTNLQTLVYFGDLLDFSFSFPPGDINFKPSQAQVQLLLL